ncbi:MAG: hypothetical protein R3F47_16475 [Gammaproteobacteria bacterium]
MESLSARLEFLSGTSKVQHEKMNAPPRCKTAFLVAKSPLFMTQESTNAAPAKLGTLVAKPEEPNGKK